jgi:glycosyltransferase involved in cell wall biosynthesis
MKIIAVGSRFNGVSYHRLFMPLRYMEKTYLMMTDQLTEDELSKGYDVVCINRYIHGMDISTLIELREKYGFKLIVDIDDFWHLDAWHVLSDVYPVDQVIQHIIAADHVIVTNGCLAAEVSWFNENVTIIPNALPFDEDQFIDIKSNDDEISDKIRFVYAGGVTHEKDVMLLNGPLKRIAGDSHLSKLVHMNLCGYSEGNEKTKMIWHRMVHDFTAGLKLSNHIRKSLPVESYMNFYNYGDVAIVPLIESKFNGMKSNLKVLESACKYLPVLASGVDPYKDCPFVVQVHKQSDWYHKIKLLATSESYRADMGQANGQWAREEHNLHKWNKVRKQVFDAVVKQ